MSLSIIFGIIFELLRNKRVQAKDLASKFEVSTKSIYRYIDAVGAGGFPVVTYQGKNGGISIDSNYLLCNFFFTKEEIQLLISMCLSKHQEKFKTICEKLKLIMSNKN